jgi:hypothetical protein
VAAAMPPRLGRSDDALSERARCGPPSRAARRDIFVPPENADWLDLRDVRAPMVEQLDRALSEATRSVVPSSVEQSAATPESKGRLDNMVQLFNNEGPWVTNQAAIVPPLERNQRFLLKLTRFGGRC